MNKRFIGNEGEELAVNFLKDNGKIIIDRNFNARGGEIDVIFKDGEYLVFCEVKLRDGLKFGDPLDAVNFSKIKNLTKASEYYLYKKHYSQDTPVRYDVIGILDGNIEWIKNAFDAFY